MPALIPPAPPAGKPVAPSVPGAASSAEWRLLGVHRWVLLAYGLSLGAQFLNNPQIALVMLGLGVLACLVDFWQGRRRS